MGTQITMLAVHALSAGLTAILYLFAVVLFIAAAVAAFPPRPRKFAGMWPSFVALGLMLMAFVLFWSAWALSSR